MYCTVDDIRQMLKSDLLKQLVRSDGVSSPEEAKAKLDEIIVQAISDAGAEIDGYIAKRYPVPLARVPAIISKYSKDIVAYNLVSRIGIGKDDDRESNYLTRYKYAIKFLEMIAKGTVDLGLTPPVKQAAKGFQVSGPGRVFSRDSLKGM